MGYYPSMEVKKGCVWVPLAMLSGLAAVAALVVDKLI